MLIAGRYEVIKCIGTGNLGIVYLCKHRELQMHPVVVKVYDSEFAKDKTARKQITNSVVQCYGLSHKNLIKMYEYTYDHEQDFIATSMEYADGGGLDDRLLIEISIPDILSILSQVCAGMQAIHDAGMIHGNLKPENILFTREGTVKLINFGGVSPGDSALAIGKIGTVAYTSPEAISTGYADLRSDLYSIGIVGYEMITGDVPFHTDSVYDSIKRKLHACIESPCQMRAECPLELGEFIIQALQVDPDRRFHSAAEMFNALQLLRGDDAEPALPLANNLGPGVN